jgi:PAS domain S-box-containing protein
METPSLVPNPYSTLPDAFSLLMRSIKDYAIITMDLQGTIIDWSLGATQVFGFTPAETVGKNASILFTPEEIAKAVPERELEMALSTGKSGDECWHLRKNGTRFLGTGVIYPLLRENGEAVGFVKIMRDYGPQRMASNALSVSEKKMEFVLENLKDHAIFLINTDGIISSWNKGTERVFGYGEEEAIGRPFSTIFTPEDIQAGIPGKELSRAQKDGKAEDERWHQRKDGSRFWASGAVVPVQVDEKDSHFIKVLRDATDRKRAEDADRMESIGRLAGGVAHDYNNMLTSIIGYCELLAISISGETEQRKWLDEMLTAANRAASLTRDLLAFSRKQIIVPKPVNLNEVIRKMEGLFRMTLGAHIQLLTELDPKLEKALLDRGQIEQVLLNLALNAREAMASGGEITIATRSAVATGASEVPTEALADDVTDHGDSKPYVTLIFKDTGKGMDAETTAHVFDPFFSTKPKSTGSVGLGLSTVYGIIQQSGGAISVSSMPGIGTEFEIHLPTIAERPAEPGQVAPVSRQDTPGPGLNRGKQETVLLVEDETGVRKLAAEVLRRQGFRILEAKDGEEGLAIFEKQRQEIDIVVSDVVMPKMSGLAMARQILIRDPDTTIVFMSGYAEDALAGLGVPDRKFVFLHKPFSVSELVGKIGEAMKERPQRSKTP